MCGTFKKKLTCWILLAGLLFATFSQNAFVSEAAKVSEKSYNVSLYGPQLFLCNKIAGSSEKGTEYFLTYTVKDAITKPETLFSLVGTADPDRKKPYADGGARRFSSQYASLMEEGCTYFIRFEVAKGAFHYDITKADKAGNLENIYLDGVTGDATDKMQYFGLEISNATVEADLTNVHCYDAEGKDLGVQVARGGAKEIKKTVDNKRYYEVDIQDQYNIVISHRRVPTTNKMYAQYTVVSGDYKLNQEGVGLAKTIATHWPHSVDGHLKLNSYKTPSSQVELLEPGASYLISMEYTEENFEVLVQKTKGNKTALFTFTTDYGPKYDKEAAEFFYLWFGEASVCKSSFYLTNLKFFDDNGNDLGVRVNQSCVVRERGEIADYAGCEATYYCKETGDSMGLFADQTMKQTLNKTVRNATYSIYNSVLKAVFEDGTEDFDFLNKRITDKEEKVYNRLYTYKAIFETGTDEKIPTQVLSNETGYLVMKPTDPVKEGYEFKGWYTSDDKEFDFDQIVTKSVSLFAKYEKVAATDTSVLPIVLGGVAIVVVAAGAVVAVLTLKRRKQHGSN